MKTITNEDVREKLPRQAKNAKAVIEIDDDDTSVEKVEEGHKPKPVRVTKTGKSLDQEKMLKRKVDNCDNRGWITINHKSGQYPMQVHLTLKTGMKHLETEPLFELLQKNFLGYMKGFNIFPQDKQSPVNCVMNN